MAAGRIPGLPNTAKSSTSASTPTPKCKSKCFPLVNSDNRNHIHAENFGERYALNPQKPGWDRHPLLEAAIERMNVPDDIAVQVTIFSEAPSGASTGTSAAVTVALIGALDFLTPGRLTPHEVAYTAQSVEVDMLHQQCGIQDQLCSAYGGINYIEMFDYPRATVSQIQIPNDIWWELERRLVLIYLGKSHSSSAVHEQVIRELEDAGPDDKRINDLRGTAVPSRNAVYAGDFAALGQAMIANTEAQRTAASRPHQPRCPARHRNRPRTWRIGLESQRRRRRRRNRHHS